MVCTNDQRPKSKLTMDSFFVGRWRRAKRENERKEEEKPNHNSELESLSLFNESMWRVCSATASVRLYRFTPQSSEKRTKKLELFSYNGIQFKVLQKIARLWIALLIPSPSLSLFLSGTHFLRCPFPTLHSHSQEYIVGAVAVVIIVVVVAESVMHCAFSIQ